MDIAFLEDDQEQADVVNVWLEDAGHNVTWFQHGQKLINVIKSKQFDMVLLDWQVPDLDGFSALKWIRQNVDRHVPIIFLTQRVADEDIVAALQSGADDYLAKPLSRAVTLARISAVARRSGLDDQASERGTVGNIQYDRIHETITVDGALIKLTRREFELAVAFLQNLGRIMPREELLKQIWGLNAAIVTRTLDTHISRIRKKLSLLPEKGWTLKSIYHHGYRLEQLENPE